MFESTVSLAPALRQRPSRHHPGAGIAPRGLAAGTLVRTIAGPRRVETLLAGDLLLDVDEQIVEIRAIRKYEARADDLVQVDPSALGLGMAPGRLDRALTIGRGQKLAIQDWRSQVVFGKPALSAAEALIDDINVRKRTDAGALLCELTFERPTVILADGICVLAGV
ncbi:Hint domain-containing protein [Roseinatronobacter alkalisoli]|uniref:Hint domain-containing protein n=1 Tax=Roseinatronobacter alkalisoli TaxID=3028235 RepID=A0ABT5TB87_9RHOB|nr:Hint domain-containing protein [Roseinatronobacter sp. HJB301]MDD7972372.1 Hint domain-containing protein [Roseinatronobacter sp. HJB301]